MLLFVRGIAIAKSEVSSGKGDRRRNTPDSPDMRKTRTTRTRITPPAKRIRLPRFTRSRSYLSWRTSRFKSPNILEGPRLRYLTIRAPYDIRTAASMEVHCCFFLSMRCDRAMAM